MGEHLSDIRNVNEQKRVARWGRRKSIAYISERRGCGQKVGQVIRRIQGAVYIL